MAYGPPPDAESGSQPREGPEIGPPDGERPDGPDPADPVHTAWVGRQRDLIEAFVRGRDLPCQVCGYNLRDLQRPNCPECGAAIYVEASIRCVPLSDGGDAVPPSVAYIMNTDAHCPACGGRLRIGNGHECPSCGWVVDVRVLRWLATQRDGSARRGGCGGATFIVIVISVLLLPCILSAAAVLSGLMSWTP